MNPPEAPAEVTSARVTGCASPYCSSAALLALKMLPSPRAHMRIMPPTTRLFAEPQPRALAVASLT